MRLETADFSNPLLQKSQQIARDVQQKSGRALLVGGFVRDLLLQQSPKDADLEIFGLEPATLRPILQRHGRVNSVGESFQVYKLTWKPTGPQEERFELDIALPRRDRRTGQGHRGFEVQGDPDMTLEEAARRRDFTVNAIFLDPLNGELLDPFDGRKDLQAGVLRMVDAKHFAEDSLRVLRAVQFAARFQMEIEPQTQAVCRSIDLSDLPKERIWGEWEKLLLKAEQPSHGLDSAQTLGVLQNLFPDLQRAMQQRGSEIQQSLDRAALAKGVLSYPQQITLMLATIGCFLGMRKTKSFLDALNIHRMQGYNIRTHTLRLVGERKRARDFFRRRDTVQDKEFRFVSARCEPRMIYILARARGQNEAAEWFKKRMQELHVFDGPPKPILMGRHLLEMGLKPGPVIGQITNAIWIQQLEGKIQDLEDAKAAANRWIETAASRT